jgi:5-methylcytosine-specific restriction protein A
MPERALKPCGRSGCPGLTAGRYCGQHAKDGWQYDQERGSSSARGYGSKWRKLRDYVLKREPLCRICLKNGRTEPAREVDHIKPKSAGGTDDQANLQGLCHQCHSRKTAEEDGGFGRLQTSAKAVR